MNERIKDCMFEAGLNSNYVEGFDSIYSKQLKKFAELIVRECAGIYSRIDNGNLHMGTDDYLEALQKTFFGETK